ncbi:MAG: hypothetical protein LBK75_06695 [Oscillospiraceae bacterium]|jgi:hypothetical protein|nr:hypothetical protein [Oscillospiraceae bacterium]
MMKNLHRYLLPLVLIFLMVVLVIGGTYAYFSYSVGNGIKGTMGAISGASDSEEYPVGVWVGSVEPGTEYPLTADFRNTGTSGVHVRANVTWVWETEKGVQVLLPSELVQVVSLEDGKDGWHWPLVDESREEGPWERLPVVSDPEKKDYLPPRDPGDEDANKASLTVTLKTAEQTPENAALFDQIAEENLYLRVKLSLEMIGDWNYHHPQDPGD